MTEYLLALDGGGTKTDVVCADLTGNVLAQGVSGPTNIIAVGESVAGLNFLAAIQQVTAQLPADSHCKVLTFGLAGADTAAEIAAAQAFFAQKATSMNISKFILVNDIDCVLESDTDQQNAVALISGTGSNCVGRNQSGQRAQTSGLDFLLADEGSGYEIGRKVLRAATSSFDGRGPKSRLESQLTEFFHVQNFPDLKEKIYNPPLSKTQIADLTLLCVKAFEEGDAVAEEILIETAEELLKMVSTVIEKLQLSTSSVDIICVGSVAKNAFVFDNLKKRLGEIFPQANLRLLDKNPVFGGVKLALKNI